MRFVMLSWEQKLKKDEENEWSKVRKDRAEWALFEVQNDLILAVLKGKVERSNQKKM